MDKSSAYKALVARAKKNYRAYDKKLVTGKGVELFAATIDGVNVCDEINLYTYWQGFGYAKKTPRVKYLLAAQDWGNFFNTDTDSDSFRTFVREMNAGVDRNYPFSMKSPTDRHLIELFKILDRDITVRCDDVFFTNFCLGYRAGKIVGGMSKKLMMRDAELFRELCEILEPENILCLGRLVSECVYKSLTGEPFKNIYGDAKSYNDFLDRRPPIVLPYGDGKLSNFHPLAHCGAMGTLGRPFDKQRDDWQAIANEMKLETALEKFSRTNSPDDTAHVLDEIFSRLKINYPFFIPLNNIGNETPLDNFIPLFRNTKSIFLRHRPDGKNYLAAFTNLMQFTKFNEANGRLFGFITVPTEKLLVDCINGGEGIILNPNDERQFILTRDMVGDLLNR